jgi:hypothetical protein
VINKWWFDELYDFVFVRPTHVVSGMIARFDRNWIDWFLDGTASTTRRFAVFWERLADQVVVDGFVNVFAGWRQLKRIRVVHRGGNADRIRRDQRLPRRGGGTLTTAWKGRPTS